MRSGGRQETKSMPNSLNKANYKRKLGSGCKMCKPQKGRGADTRKLSDKKADVSRIEQFQDLSQ